ncbi:MAG: PEP-CTERM sorting domain-containing protein [Candidatus Nealsonbacteria bacterium]|nr:PEP-CTERM sorting domain-containing protein [Candidatus Nealsonbacteria bacterium]
MRNVLTALMIVGALACPVAADWVVEDGHKMHWPQMPDPLGWDIDIVWPNVVADDWKCGGTGPVKDVHLWVSVEGDRDSEPAQQALAGMEYFHLSIHKDIPAAESPTGYSMPLDPPVWERNFDPVQVVISPNVGQGVQGFATPTVGPDGWRLDDHNLYYLANIMDIQDPFVQREGEIYWLDVSVKMRDDYQGPRIGWKTTLQDLEFNDDAVFFVEDAAGNVHWQELWEYGEVGGHSLDMAFVVVPEPGTLVMLLGAGLIAMLTLLRRRRSH